jgi:hypothetical protein
MGHPEPLACQRKAAGLVSLLAYAVGRMQVRAVVVSHIWHKQRARYGAHAGRWRVRGKAAGLWKSRLSDEIRTLEGSYLVDTVGAENTELPLSVAAKVNASATTLRSTGEKDLIGRPAAWPVFVLDQYLPLHGHGMAQPKIGESDYLGGNRWDLEGVGAIVRLHSTIEPERMYPLK